MPISNKDLGKYKKPGIYMNEIDQSAIALPIQDVMVNLIPGFSKRGPFNKPVWVDDPNNFEKIYGTLDKNLENKGSFFHRTATEMLRKGPIWALNLLATDPNRDKLEWQSISVAAQYDNGPKNTSAYEYFFNRQDFWERDTEAFMDVVTLEYQDNPSTQPDPSEVLFHLTNMGDKKVTAFIYKSSATGFDVSAEEWYGSLDKIPLFLNAKDWMSDYIITVLVVGGDWSDYTTLAADTHWGAYFNSRGLIKSQVENFVNDDYVSLIAYYDGSLIPNFRDTTGRDMYIRNLINADTEKTGLFCYYNEDALLNADAYNGVVDIIGSTMVCEETVTTTCKKTIDFLSYNATLSEMLSYAEKDLDYLSNVFGNYSGMTTAIVGDRTAEYTNWYTEMVRDTFSTAMTSVASITNSAITLTSASGFVVDDKIFFTKSFSVIDSTAGYYITSIDTNTITISAEKGGGVITSITSGTTTNIYVYKLAQSYDISSNATYNLNGAQYTLATGDFYFDPFVINNITSDYSRIDVAYLGTDYSTIHTVKGTQVTSGATKPNFMLNGNETIILGYVTLSYAASTTGFTATWTDVTVNNSSYVPLGVSDLLFGTGSTIAGVNYLDIEFLGTLGSTVYNNYEKLRKTKIFTELYSKLLLNKGVIVNLTDGSKFEVVTPTIYGATTTTNAKIRIYFDTTTDPNEYFSGTEFLVYYVDDEFKGYEGMDKVITSGLPAATAGCGVMGKQSELYLAYYNGTINNNDYVYKYNDTNYEKIYLKMYLDSDKKVTVKFASEPSVEPDITITNWATSWFTTGTTVGFNIYSDKDNFKQTLEIEGTITDQINTSTFYIDNTRYPEIQRGWFIEAYYDTTYYEAGGEGYLLGAYPRKLARVIRVGRDTVNPDLKIVITDAPIKIHSNSGGTELYTTAYKSIDNYVTEYCGLMFNPFVVHQDSIPNGTEARLQTILDVVDKDTNLAKGLANKNRISWRYLVDTFGLGLSEHSKQQLADLCGLKLNCFGFINMPSVRLFKTSIDPSFINDDRTLNTEYLKEGGNLDLNPSFLYSLAEGVGRSCVGYFFPYVKDVNDNTKFIPPSIKVAQAYMAKFTGELSNSYPWTIVAGPQLSLMKEVQTTEMRFTEDDLENLYTMGVNPIVYTLNKGYNIYCENTAQVYPVSSLSYIHSREVLIELENRLYDMLLNYHWKFNTPEMRAEIKFRADLICKELLNQNALYDFKNVCDKSNNTDYIIDLQIGVLDTYVEIIKGMGIIVNNITILKKGTIQSGGFIQQY